MTELEIEQEIQARIEFKMNEFKTSLKNRLYFKYGEIFDQTKESYVAWKAFEEICEILRKEVQMPTPHNNMAKERKRNVKEVAVEKIIKTLDLRGRDYNDKIRSIVSAVEIAQDW